MIHIYYTFINEDRHSQLSIKFQGLYPKLYTNKIQKFVRWQDAQLSMLGKLLLVRGCSLLNKNIDVKSIEYSQHNKPHFKNSNVHFNISHSGDMAVCAISDEGEIGIDVEVLKEIRVDEFKDILTENEWQRVTNSEDTLAAFLEFWTEKEAVVKAHGNGLAIPLKSFEIISGKTSILGTNFNLKKIDVHPNYKCHIAFDGKYSGANLSVIEVQSNYFI